MFIYSDNEQLKKELKKCIIDNGYTAKQICDSLDMLPQTYQTLINKKNFSFADMKRILDVKKTNTAGAYIELKEITERTSFLPNTHKILDKYLEGKKSVPKK